MPPRPRRSPFAMMSTRTFAALLVCVGAVLPSVAASPSDLVNFDPITLAPKGNVDLTPSRNGYTSYTYEVIPDTSAQCLDGSRYGVFVCQSNKKSWEIAIQGGGWCYNETLCLERAATPLGSSSTWPPLAKTMTCDPQSDTSIAMLYYCDGASFSGYREDPWPVPGSSSSLMFRGIRNLDASLDMLYNKYNLSMATEVVLTGGSAGGLSTFLHLDHVAKRIPQARVVGRPVCGFFLDHGNDGFAPPELTYTNEMKYVYNMQNSTGSLSTQCQSSFGPDNAWKCIMAPHATPFIHTPWFMFQSRFDHWQLAEELFLPCIKAQPYHPPYVKSTCDVRQDQAISSYGPDFMAQLTPIMNITRNGGFVDACIIHGSTNSSIDGKNNYDAFEDWFQGGSQHWYLMKCQGSTSAGPCDPSPVCAPYP